MLMLCASYACADWKYLTESIKGDTYSIDLGSVKKFGGNLRAWTLTSYKTPLVGGGYTVKSVKSLDEFDCKEGKYRVIQESWHSEENGLGSVVYTTNEISGWRYAPTDSTFEVVLKAVCKK